MSERIPGPLGVIAGRTYEFFLRDISTTWTLTVTDWGFNCAGNYASISGRCAPNRNVNLNVDHVLYCVEVSR